jgi:hypothetical protein
VRGMQMQRRAAVGGYQPCPKDIRRLIGGLFLASTCCLPRFRLAIGGVETAFGVANGEWPDDDSLELITGSTSTMRDRSAGQFHRWVDILVPIETPTLGDRSTPLFRHTLTMRACLAVPGEVSMTAQVTLL